MLLFYSLALIVTTFAIQKCFCSFLSVYLFDLCLESLTLRTCRVSLCNAIHPHRPFCQSELSYLALMKIR